MNTLRNRIAASLANLVLRTIATKKYRDALKATYVRGLGDLGPRLVFGDGASLDTLASSLQSLRGWCLSLDGDDVILDDFVQGEDDWLLLVRDYDEEAGEATGDPRLVSWALLDMIYVY